MQNNGEILGKINSQLSRVKIREKNGSLYLRGQFPVDGELIRKEIALKCKANAEGFKIALAKAKEIDAQLLLGKWEDAEKSKLTVGNAFLLFSKDYWTKHKKTVDSLYNWEQNYLKFYNELPEDELFNIPFIKKIIAHYPSGSYMQKKACQLLRPVAKFHNIKFDFTPYMSYQSGSVQIKDLPPMELVAEVWQNENYLPHKWGLGVLAVFGLRPHEIFKSDFLFDQSPPKLLIWKNTKTKDRTVFPVPFEGIDLFSIPIQKLTFKWDDKTPNRKLGGKVSNWFLKYPFNAYQLRHLYAVRGAMKGISPTFLSKWMGHSLPIHYKHYGSLLGDLESEKLWKDKFS